MEWIVPLVTLTGMEIVLGIDNIIFLAILAGRLPKEQRGYARQIGLILALGTRLLLQFSISWILSLHQIVLTLPDWAAKTEEAREISWKDLILLAGGLFLIAKSIEMKLCNELKRPWVSKVRRKTYSKSLT